MRSFILLILISFSNFSSAQTELYSKAFGKITDPAIIFLHGGPGYNAVSFEYTSAQKIADNGFYVIVYDQRGSGRSTADASSKYTFIEAFDDLNRIYERYSIKKASLIGHSFGGTVGIKFSNAFPGKVTSLILVGSPLSYQVTFKGIISRCKEIYRDQKSAQLQYIEMLEKMDTSSLQYSSYSFMHAMTNGFYKTKDPSPEAKQLYLDLKNSPDAAYLSKMTQDPVSGFYANEHYTTLNLYSDILELKKKIKVYGIYGSEDGLFDNTHRTLLYSALGKDSYIEVNEASHSVFIDQQTAFINVIKEYAK